MRFKSLVSPLAIVIGLGMAGAAVAQDAAAEAEATWTIENGAMMIDGVAVTEEQADYIQNYCDDLQQDFENESPGVGDGSTTEDEAGEDDSAGGNDEDASDADDSEPSLEDMPTSMINFDLSQLTRDDCVEAGFITE